jgi:hypothetical protein
MSELKSKPVHPSGKIDQEDEGYIDSTEGQLDRSKPSKHEDSSGIPRKGEQHPEEPQIAIGKA